MPHLRSQSNRSSAFSSSPVDLGPRSRGRSWTLLLNRLGPAGEIIGQPRPSSHLRTLAGDRQRPYGSSAEVWSVYGAQRSQPVATGSKCDGREDGSNRRKPLPWVATGCRDPKMVRRGSTVRVRQRASVKCLQIGTLLLSVRETRGHRTDTSTVHASQRDVSRRLLTQTAGRETVRRSTKSLQVGRVSRLSSETSEPLSTERGSSGSNPMTFMSVGMYADVAGSSPVAF